MAVVAATAGTVAVRLCAGCAVEREPTPDSGWVEWVLLARSGAPVVRFWVCPRCWQCGAPRHQGMGGRCD